MNKILNYNQYKTFKINENVDTITDGHPEGTISGGESKDITNQLNKQTFDVGDKVTIRGTEYKVYKPQVGKFVYLETQRGAKKILKVDSNILVKDNRMHTSEEKFLWNKGDVIYTKVVENNAEEQHQIETPKVDIDLKKSFEQVTKNYPDSELAGQDGSTIGLSKITVDGGDVYIQAIEHVNIPDVKPVVAWNTKGENIALASFKKNKDGTWYSMQSETNKSLQRKGVMTAIYNLAEKVIGKLDESKEQTAEAKAFWKKRNMSYINNS